MKARIKVLCIDDSSLARENYRRILNSASGMDLVAAASDAVIGRKRLQSGDPDVVVLDIEMPGTDGFTFLKWLMRAMPTPVVISSSMSREAAGRAMSALELGAVEVISKGEAMAGDGVWSSDFRTRLVDAIRTAAEAKPRMRRLGPKLEAKNLPPPPAVRILAGKERPYAPRPAGRVSVPAAGLRAGPVVFIGASTGGTEAIAQMIRQMPSDFPPTIVVQHMPPLFTQSFAERLNEMGSVQVREAWDGMGVETGQVTIAPGGKHLRVRRGGAKALCLVSPGEPVNRHIPSIDVLFESATRAFGPQAIGVLLTGMGADGADGLLQMRQEGSFTIAQDEATSVVYGMPQEAYKRGAAESVLALEQIVPRICSYLGGLQAAARAEGAGAAL